MSPQDLPLLSTDGAAEGNRSALILPFVLGMGINLVSLLVGEPYRMAELGLAVALVATLAWSARPLTWIVFTAVLAANPANTSTPVALNLFCAAVYFALARRSGVGRLPRLAQVALFLAVLSLVISILASLWLDPATATIHTTDVSQPRPWGTTWAGGASMEMLTSQGVSVANYLLGPFLFIPLICSRIREDHDPDLLLKGLVLGFLVPTLLMFLLARTLGKPTFDANALREGMLNVSTFRLGQLDIQMIRTQVGIVLAALICASFAVAVAQVGRGVRLAAAACLALSGYFLLVTGSVGSSLAALAGIVLILLLGKRRFSVRRYALVLVAGGGLLVGAWAVLPEGVQRYAVTRYEVRVGGGGPATATADRAWRWKKSFSYLMDNPSGVGWSLYVEPLGIYPHNDYLTYGIAFGVLCGLLYFLLPSGLLLSFVAFKPGAAESARFALSLAGAGAATVLLLNSLSDHMTANRWYFNVVWMMIWYAFFASRARPVAAETPEGPPPADSIQRSPLP
ncbi:O-antigen ligase family protein [Geothrix edaphica]|uniref:O-antigen ligase-related domain-containing protein n=1 Tax=Geothrix edaphica TaxID=2927976 RepID=A0ABQ5PW18_9BACT|nr:O-antigen ligase family protein [Geothrix edaphica]GLH66284.1 hypothetical protein GETHED_06480 [Geothrix edaphica]